MTLLTSNVYKNIGKNFVFAHNFYFKNLLQKKFIQSCAVLTSQTSAYLKNVYLVL